MNKIELKKLMSENLDTTLEWMDENLLKASEVQEITNQTRDALSQSVRTKKLLPFFVRGDGNTKVSLYYKNDVEIYAQKIKNRQNANKK